MSQLTLFAEKGIRIKEVPNYVIDELFIKYHYSKKVTKNRWLSFAIFYNGNLEGGMQLGYGIRPKSKEHIIRDVNSDEIREFDRMWISDKLPKNSESKCIGFLLRYIRKKYPDIKVIISYADGLRGKVGTIYQASNFIYVGCIKGEFYYLPDKDEWIHPVSMYHRHGTRAKEFLEKIYPGIEHIYGEQHRYIYFLDSSLKDKLLLPIVPYPKKQVFPVEVINNE